MKSFFSVHGPIHLDCFRKADVIKVEVDTCWKGKERYSFLYAMYISHAIHSIFICMYQIRACQYATIHSWSSGVFVDTCRTILRPMPFSV